MTEEKLERANKLIEEIHNIQEWIFDDNDDDFDSLGSLIYNFPEIGNEVKKVVNDFLKNKLDKLKAEFENL